MNKTPAPHADPHVDPQDKLALIGVAVGSGAPDQGCADGPKALADGGLLAHLASAGLAAEWLARMTAPHRMQGDDALAITAALGKELAATTEQLSRAHRRFVSIGGDHSAAIG